MLTLVRRSIEALALVSVSFLISQPASASSKISFFRYEIASEEVSDWETLVSVDRAATNELLGVFTLKAKPASKLMAIRRDDSGDKICARERNDMSVKKTKFEALQAPKGWSCVLSVAAQDRLIAVKSFFIKGKSRSTPFSLVLVGESLPRDRFLKAVSAVKDVP